MPPELAALQSFLAIGAVLFGVGLIGFLSRRNMIVMFLSAEMMLQGVSLSLVAWGRYHHDLGGQMLVIFIIAVAACEAAIALALVLMLFERKGHLDIAMWQELRESNQPPFEEEPLPPESGEEPAALAALDPGGRVAGIGRRGRVLPPQGLKPSPRPSPEAWNRTFPNLLIAIPALPLAAAAVVAVLGKRVLREQSHWPVALALAGSCLASVLLIFAVQQGQKDHQHEHLVRLWTWAAVEAGSGAGAGSGEQGAGEPELSTQYSVLSTQYSVPDSVPTPAFRMDIVLRADSLTAIMLGMVTFISTLVVIYASGYMHGDPGYWRFFAYVALFVFSMTMLVSVSNFVLLYVFWEAVGLCSYLLIGFWFEKPAAAAAGMKAFLVNRVGDFGFALGVFLLWTTFGTLDFHDSKVETIPAAGGHAATTVVHVDPHEIDDPNVPGTVEHGIFGHWRLTQEHPFGEGGVITAICLLLFVGACGKSAQFPLHVWLPDAMEGPTPVSALIHAATMVTAGVYLVARCTPLYAAAPYAQEVVSTIGGFTALLCRADRPDANRFEADPGLFDRQPARLHVPGPGHGQPTRRDLRHVPPVHARLLQGPVVPRRRQRDARHGRSDRHSPVRRAAAEDADNPLDLPLRLPGPVGHLPLRRLLEQRRHSGRGGRKGERGPRARSMDTFITAARSRPSLRRSTRSGPISSRSMARSGFPRRPDIMPTSRRRP